MKLFLITHPSYKGAVQVFYTAEGILSKLDFTGTDMQAAHIDAMKRKVAVLETNLQSSFDSKEVAIVPGEYEVSFEDFQREYPYKRNTHKAREYWPKMSKADQVQAYFAAIDYRKYCEKNSAWYNPKIADSWLRNKEYLNNWKQL